LATIAAEKEELHVVAADRAWYRRMVRSRNAYLLCLSELFYGLAGFVFTTWFYKYFVEAREAGRTLAAFLYSLNYLAMAVGAPAGGFLCDLCVRRWGSPWGRRTVPLVSITLAGCAATLAPAIPNNVASALVFAVAAGLFFTAAAAFWSTLIDITRRGTGILGGLMNGSGQIGSGIGTISFAWLKDWMGWEGALQLSGLMGIASGLVWLWIDSSRQIDEDSSVPQEQPTAAATSDQPKNYLPDS
jgi:MFS family permease